MGTDMKFEHAIVRRPGTTLVHGITTAGLGEPDYNMALLQHDAYVNALRGCEVDVRVLDALEDFPDGMFVEDTAVVTEKFSLIARPGASARQGEERSIKETMADYSENVESITSPGSLDGGDVMQVGDHFYVGLSARTNREGFRQFKTVMETYGYTVSPVDMTAVLHLKTGLAYLENNVLLVAGEFVDHPEFKKFDQILIDPDESYAANCIWVNGTVLVPAGYPRTCEAIEKKGYPVISLDTSEFRKLDGGLSCLSLRF